MIRVLMISHTCQSRTEGQPKARRLAEHADIDLRVIVPDRWRHYGKPRRADVTADDAPLLQPHRVRFPWVSKAQCYLHHYPDLSRVLRSFRPHVIDLWEEPWSAVSAQAVWLRDRLLPGTKVISETEQNIDKSLPPPFSWFRRYTLRRSDYVVCRNHEAVSVVRRHGYAGPAEVVPNGVDNALFAPADRRAARAALRIDDGHFVVGYVGRMVREKGVSDLLASLASLPTHVRALFVGDGPMRAELEQAARDLSLADRVTFIPGMPLTDLPRVMNAIDALVLPSWTTASWKEQFGRVLIEAACCRTPVIGSDSGAIPDVVGGGGLVYEEKNIDALAACIRRLATDRAAAMQMGEEGYRRANAEFTWERVAERMASIYRRVCDQTTSAAPGRTHATQQTHQVPQLRTPLEGVRPVGDPL